MPNKASAKFILIALLSCLCYLSIGFFIERHETTLLLPCYFLLFALYLWLYPQNEGIVSFKSLVIFGIVCRILLLLSFPTLSDDVYRFIWDGRLLTNGINPFLQLPTYYLGLDAPLGINEALFSQLNSQGYFTIYPPIAQIIFWLAAVVSPDNILASIVVMRLVNIIADLGVLWFMLKLLDHYKLPKRSALLFFLNPLVVLELTGNLHHEGIMLLFILGGIYFAIKQRWYISGSFWALAVATKLLPLIFLPFLLFKNKISNSIKLFSSSIVTILMLFIPFLNVGFINGFSSSLELYFQKFEFNASLYYIAREFGYWIIGYNAIQTIGVILAITAFIWIVFLSTKSNRNEQFRVFVLILTSYLLLSTTVHPWYIITILGLSVFTHYRFSVLWTLLIFTTYSGYTLNGYNENLWLVTMEYLAIITVLIYEWKTEQPILKSLSTK